MNHKYVMCISNEGYRGALVPRKVYMTLSDPEAEQTGMIRVIDESGEDYLFEADLFVPVELPPESEDAFARVPA